MRKEWLGFLARQRTKNSEAIFVALPFCQSNHSDRGRVDLSIHLPLTKKSFRLPNFAGERQSTCIKTSTRHNLTG